MPITFDIDDFLNPQQNNFCSMYPFPVTGAGGFQLYYQAVPGGQLVAMGGRLKNIETASGIISVLSLIAFSSPDKLRQYFPAAFDHIKILEGHEGIPASCGQIYVPLPESVPLQYRIEALKNADTVVSFPLNAPVPDDADPGDFTVDDYFPTVPDDPPPINPRPHNGGSQYHIPDDNSQPAASGIGRLVLFGFIASLLN